MLSILGLLCVDIPRYALTTRRYIHGVLVMMRGDGLSVSPACTRGESPPAAASGLRERYQGMASETIGVRNILCRPNIDCRPSRRVATHHPLLVDSNQSVAQASTQAFTTRLIPSAGSATAHGSDCATDVLAEAL